MSNVQFDENNLIQTMPRQFANSRQSFLTRIILKFGLAKDASGVKKVFIAIIVICLVSTAIILFTGRSSVKNQTPVVGSPQPEKQF